MTENTSQTRRPGTPPPSRPDPTVRTHRTGYVPKGMHGPNWAWRHRLRANPHSHRVLRLAVGVVGGLVVALGLVLVPFPGPGWAIVFLGVAIWASEFHWAHRLLHFGKDVLRNWNAWMGRQGWAVRLVVVAATFAVVLALFWVLFRLTGVPSLLPDPIEDLARRTTGR